MIQNTITSKIAAVWEAWKSKGHKELSGKIMWTPKDGIVLTLEGENIPRIRDVNANLTALGPNATLVLRELTSHISTIQADTRITLQKFKYIKVEFVAEEQEIGDF